jgi:hypothetical protein
MKVASLGLQGNPRTRRSRGGYATLVIERVENLTVEVYADNTIAPEAVTPANGHDRVRPAHAAPLSEMRT